MSGSNTNGERKRVGQPSRYLNGGENTLVSRSRNPGENLELHGQWPYEQLLRMDADFITAMERAFHSGRELRASASACERPDAGDRDRLLLAS